jgi:hypothetical protein
MSKKKKERIIEKERTTIPGGLLLRLEKHFFTAETLRNSDVREMAELGKNHREAGRILRECEVRGLLRRADTTKQAAIYRKGPNL